jgi:hypothetical protein
MPKKTYRPEEIIAKLCQAEVLIGDGKKVPEVVKGETVGYLKRDIAAPYSPALMKVGHPLECRVTLEQQVPGDDGVILAFFEDVLPPPSAVV